MFDSSLLHNYLEEKSNTNNFTDILDKKKYRHPRHHFAAFHTQYYTG